MRSEKGRIALRILDDVVDEAMQEALGHEVTIRQYEHVVTRIRQVFSVTLKDNDTARNRYNRKKAELGMK